MQLSEETSFIEEMAKEGMEGMDPLMLAACFALADEALAEGAEAYGLACGFSEETVTQEEVAELKRDALGSKTTLEKVLSVQEAGKTPVEASLEESDGCDSDIEKDEMVAQSPTPPDDATRQGGTQKGDGTLTGHLVEVFNCGDTSKPLTGSKKAASFFRSSRVSPDRSEDGASYTKPRKRKASDVFRYVSSLIASPFRRFLRRSRQPARSN